MTQITAREAAPAGADVPAAGGAGRSLIARARSAAATFWLGVLFNMTALSPWFVRLMRPVCVSLSVVCSRKIRQCTAANARRIFDRPISRSEQWRFANGVVGSFYDFVCDFGRSSRATRDELLARIESVEGLEAYRAARQGRKGAIVLTAHMGSFEVGLASLSQQEPKIHVVFRRDQSRRFEALRAGLRKRLGVAEATVEEGWPVWMRLRDALQNDEVVAIQGDRVMPGQKGVRVPLLGGHVMLPAGPVKLALASGAPIIPIFSIRTAGDGVRIFIERAIDVSVNAGGDPLEAALREIAAVLAKYVAAYPDQWLVLDKAFTEDQPAASNGAPEANA